MNPRPSLKDFTTDELLAEIVRRRNQPDEGEESPTVWCDDCPHFRTWSPRPGDPPRNYNPCSRHHKPHFWVPKPWESPEHYGYYLRVCPDRPV
jgi:hypothetical protein